MKVIIVDSAVHRTRKHLVNLMQFFRPILLNIRREHPKPAGKPYQLLPLINIETAAPNRTSVK